MTQITNLPKPKLSEFALYFGDNGRVTCGQLRHAGMSAHFTGRDISGQRMRLIKAEVALVNGIDCDACARGKVR